MSKLQVTLSTGQHLCNMFEIVYSEHKILTFVYDYIYIPLVPLYVYISLSFVVMMYIIVIIVILIIVVVVIIVIIVIITITHSDVYIYISTLCLLHSHFKSSQMRSKQQRTLRERRCAPPSHNLVT